MGEHDLPPQETESDALLVRACLSGRRTAFDALVRRHHRRVFGLALLWTRDAHAAEDITQDAFLLAYSSLGRCAEPERFGAWLAGITRNSAREWLRRCGKAMPLDTLHEEGVDMLAEQASLDERQARLAALERAVASLPPEARQILLLKYQDRQSCAEIAARLGMKTNTVAKTLSRAYGRLAEIIGPRGQAES
jgi:RNA polymerase sigma factor (sigma-70 family)